MDPIDDVLLARIAQLEAEVQTSKKSPRKPINWNTVGCVSSLSIGGLAVVAGLLWLCLGFPTNNVYAQPGACESRIHPVGIYREYNWGKDKFFGCTSIGNAKYEIKNYKKLLNLNKYNIKSYTGEATGSVTILPGTPTNDFTTRHRVQSETTGDLKLSPGRPEPPLWFYTTRCQKVPLAGGVWEKWCLVK